MTRLAHTKAHAVQATAPIALHAITGHIVTHRLPLPASIMLPNCADPNLTIGILPEHVGQWLASGVELGEQTVRPSSYDDHLRVHAPARLDCGVVFRLGWLERRTLRAVVSR